MIKSELSDKMIALADQHELNQEHSLRKLADQLNHAITSNNPRELLEIWGKAKQCYNDYLRKQG